MKPHIIGIAGKSSSGKTELARPLARNLPGTPIVSLDSYYRGMDEIPLEARKKANFDHPDALDWPLLHQHLLAMADGQPFDQPVYSFRACTHGGDQTRRARRFRDRGGTVRTSSARLAGLAGH
jgi:uridine kinase